MAIDNRLSPLEADSVLREAEGKTVKVILDPGYDEHWTVRFTDGTSLALFTDGSVVEL